MVEIIPAILAKSFGEFTNKIKRVENLVAAVQIDVMDGEFVPNKTYNNIDQIKTIKTVLDFDVHLMVNNVEEFITGWMKLKPRRIIFHIEAVRPENINDLIQKIRNFGSEIGIAINPNSELSKIEPYLDEMGMVLVMGVNPGFSGQKLQKGAIERVRQIKTAHPRVKIGVDGGININNIKELALAGADTLVVGSAIFKSDNVVEVIKALKKAGK